MSTTTFTLTVRGIRLVSREWSLRDKTYPITLTQSTKDPQILATNIDIMLRDAVGLYHHDSRTYIPVEQIRPEFFVDSILSRLDGTTDAGGSARTKIWGKEKKKKKRPRIWDVVYPRPVVQVRFEGQLLNVEKPTFWEDVKRYTWMLWDGTYVYLRIKRPLIYIEDLQRGDYMPTWRRRGKRKLAALFNRTKQ